MRRRLFTLHFVLPALLGLVFFANTARSAIVTVGAAKDNSLFENQTGSESNGAGESIFAGRTGVNDGFKNRRALLAFDLSSIPAGSTINSVTLTLFLAQASALSLNTTVSVHPVMANWGEGTSLGNLGNPAPSTPGDATWIHRSFNTQLWATPGGDFDPQVSASTIMSSAGQTYSWTGAGLAEDVQAWITTPATNFGWLLRGNEAVDQSAVRFNSKEVANPAHRPQLTVNYTALPEPSGTALILGGLLTFLARKRTRR
jgi:hypothetical protein